MAKDLSAAEIETHQYKQIEASNMRLKTPAAFKEWYNSKVAKDARKELMKLLEYTLIRAVRSCFTLLRNQEGHCQVQGRWRCLQGGLGAGGR